MRRRFADAGSLRAPHNQAQLTARTRPLEANATGPWRQHPRRRRRPALPARRSARARCQGHSRPELIRTEAQHGVDRPPGRQCRGWFLTWRFCLRWLRLPLDRARAAPLRRRLRGFCVGLAGAPPASTASKRGSLSGSLSFSCDGTAATLGARCRRRRREPSLSSSGAALGAGSVVPNRRRRRRRRRLRWLIQVLLLRRASAPPLSCFRHRLPGSLVSGLLLLRLRRRSADSLQSSAAAALPCAALRRRGSPAVALLWDGCRGATTRSPALRRPLRPRSMRHDRVRHGARCLAARSGCGPGSLSGRPQQTPLRGWGQWHRLLCSRGGSGTVRLKAAAAQGWRFASTEKSGRRSARGSFPQRQRQRRVQRACQRGETSSAAAQRTPRRHWRIEGGRCPPDAACAPGGLARWLRVRLLVLLLRSPVRRH